MNKKILTIALAAVAMLGFSANAQNRTDKTTCDKQATCQNDDNRIRRPLTWREHAFEGVLLSVEQQGKIDAINKEFESKFAPQTCTSDTCKAKFDKKDKKDKKDRKHDPRNRGDRKGPKNQANFKVRSEYIAQVKQVLTPEQYTTFLENIVNMPAKQNQQYDPRLRSGRSQATDSVSKMKREERKIQRDARKVERQAKKDARRAEKGAKKDFRKIEEKVENAVK